MKDFERRGFATLICLPLKNSAVFALVREKVEEVEDGAVLFLEKTSVFRQIREINCVFVTSWSGFIRRMLMAVSVSYRPELHYMLGPGPKWREKHARP